VYFSEKNLEDEDLSKCKIEIHPRDTINSEKY